MKIIVFRIKHFQNNCPKSCRGEKHPSLHAAWLALQESPVIPGVRDAEKAHKLLNAAKGPAMDRG